MRTMHEGDGIVGAGLASWYSDASRVRPLSWAKKITFDDALRISSRDKTGCGALCCRQATWNVRSNPRLKNRHWEHHVGYFPAYIARAREMTNLMSRAISMFRNERAVIQQAYNALQTGLAEAFAPSRWSRSDAQASVEAPRGHEQ